MGTELKTFIFGHTSLGRPIPAWRTGSSGPEVLILGGVHGDESEGVTLALGLIEEPERLLGFKLSITLVPMFNLDGTLSQQRLNARGVDLNRNLPTRDWTNQVLNPRYQPGPFAGSEPENQALLEWLSAHPPQLIISLHSWHPTLNVNGACRPEAEVLQRWLGYPITEDMGYPTPGCLGTYCGLERDMPTLTFEIERGLAPKRILNQVRPALFEALKVSEGRFENGKN